MKKSIFMAVLGLAAGAATSFGQGYVIFTSYIANSNSGATTSLFGSNALIGTGYTADLYYFLGTVSDPVNESSPSSITSAPTGLTDLGVTAAYDNSGGATGAVGVGYFDGNQVTIPGYSGGSVTFEVVAFNGSSYATSSIRGRSGTFTMSSLSTSLQSPAPNLGDNGSPMPNFLVAPVPEPTTLALAGLGGLASLVAIRRKKV